MNDGLNSEDRLWASMWKWFVILVLGLTAIIAASVSGCQGYKLSKYKGMDARTICVIENHRQPERCVSLFGTAGQGQ